MKLLIFTMGPGETSQGYAVAKYFNSKGSNIIFALRKKINEEFLNNNKIDCEVHITETLSALKSLVNKKKPDALLLCNSKLPLVFPDEKNLILNSPFKNVYIATLDSNWLFNEKTSLFAHIKWADKYYINLPNQVFQSGLKKNSGYFQISDIMLNNIKVIGLIPSYEPISKKLKIRKRKALGVEKDEKLIVCYFSGSGADGKEWVLRNLIRTVNKIQSPLRKIKIIAIGNYDGLTNKLPQLPWVNYLSNLHDIEEFYTAVASADLLFQHQGLATMAQAISAQVPVIANVGIYPGQEYPGLHPAELIPFEKNGLCKICYRFSPTSKIKTAIEKLLYNDKEILQIKKAQKNNFSSGETVLYSSLQYEITNFQSLHRKY